MGEVFTPPQTVKIGDFAFLISKLEKILKTRGINGLILYLKDLRLALLHHLSGEFPKKRVEGIPTDKTGFPKVLRPLKEKLGVLGTVNIYYLRFLTTILFSSRYVGIGKEPDVESIYAKATKPYPDISKHIGSFWSTLGYRPLRKVPASIKWKEYHFTTKKGPNGQALFTSLTDLGGVLNNEQLFNSIKIVGGSKLARTLDLLKGYYEYLPT